jgi:hypothetical protein
MKNTKTIIAKFTANIDVDKKYKSSELISILSNIYDLHSKKSKLTHEVPLLLRKNDIKKK